MFQWNLLYLSICPLPPVLSLDTTEKGLAPTFLLSLTYTLIYLYKPSPVFNNPSSLCLFLSNRCSNSLVISVSLTEPTAVCLCLSCTGNPRTGNSTPDVSHQI